jgi:hypothetical protein
LTILLLSQIGRQTQPWSRWDSSKITESVGKPILEPPGGGVAGREPGVAADEAELRGLLLATCPEREVRDGAAAIEVAERGRAPSDGTAAADFLNTLAHAEAANPAKAVELQRQVVGLSCRRGRWIREISGSLRAAAGERANTASGPLRGTVSDGATEGWRRGGR